MINLHRYQYLASKWMSGTISEAEKEEFLAWYNDVPVEEMEVSTILANDEEELKTRMFEEIEAKLQQSEKKTLKKFSIYKYTAIAASILCVFIWGIYHVQFSKKPQEIIPNDVEAVGPGMTRAKLTLDNGEEFQLSSTKSGIRVGHEIAYFDGSKVSNSLNGQPKTSISYAVMTTPRGGEYKLQLEDGTVVWLNSETTLRFPSSFTTETRKVELIAGEAFFEVKKKESNNKRIPFEVMIKNQKIEVLGTAFNVKSYGKAEETITTVSEGTVAVKSIDPTQEVLEKVILHKGGQSILYKGQITKKIVDPEEFTAWKDGYFYFVDADIYQVMNEFMRWYDIDVNYEMEKSDDLFNGRIPKNVNLGKALNILKLAGVNFELKNNKILTINRKPN